MKDEKDLINYVNKMSENEIQKLRQSYKENQKIDDYLFKTCKIIFKKFASPYIRFEILRICIDDIKDNYKKYYPPQLGSGFLDGRHDRKD